MPASSSKTRLLNALEERRGGVSSVGEVFWDEEPEVTHHLEMALDPLDYSVHSVRNGDELLGLLQDSEIEISALFLGLAMLDRGGLDTLREIRAIDSKLPVIIVSGLCLARDVVAALKGGALIELGTDHDAYRHLVVASAAASRALAADLA